MTDTDDLTSAMQALVDVDDPRPMRAALDAIFSFNKVYRVRFVGEYARLNPVVDAVLSGAKDYNAIKLLIDARRQDADRALMFPPVEHKYDQRTAQRVLMRERRERSSRALRIENKIRPPEDKLFGVTRLEFERATLARWGRELERDLSIERERHGGVLPRAERARIRHKFWTDIDAQLDAKEAELRRQGKM